MRLLLIVTALCLLGAGCSSLEIESSTPSTTTTEATTTTTTTEAKIVDEVAETEVEEAPEQSEEPATADAASQRLELTLDTNAITVDVWRVSKMDISIRPRNNRHAFVTFSADFTNTREEGFFNINGAYIDFACDGEFVYSLAVPNPGGVATDPIPVEPGETQRVENASVVRVDRLRDCSSLEALIRIAEGAESEFNENRDILEGFGFRMSDIPAAPATPNAVLPHDTLPPIVVLSIPLDAQLTGDDDAPNIDDFCARLASNDRSGQVFDSPEYLVDVDRQSAGYGVARELGSWECWVVENGFPVTRIEAIAIPDELSDEDALATWCGGCQNFEITDRSPDGILTFVRPGLSDLDIAHALRVDDTLYGVISVLNVDQLGLSELPEIAFEFFARNEQLIRLIRDVVSTT